MSSRTSDVERLVRHCQVQGMKVEPCKAGWKVYGVQGGVVTVHKTSGGGRGYANCLAELKRIGYVPDSTAKAPLARPSKPGRIGVAPKTTKRRGQDLKCEVCDKPYRYQSRLDQHMQDAHPKPAPKPEKKAMPEISARSIPVNRREAEEKLAEANGRHPEAPTSEPDLTPEQLQTMVAAVTKVVEENKHLRLKNKQLEEQLKALNDKHDQLTKVFEQGVDLI